MPIQPFTLQAPDVQAQPPTLAIGLSRVGVTGVEKVIRVRQHGAEQLFSARLDCFVDLAGDQKGAHMSRFEEVVNEVIGEVVLGESTFRAEDLAQRVAELVRERQRAQRAEVTDRRALPRAQAGARVRRQHPGDLHAARAGGRLRARHATSRRRRRTGHDGLPVRAGARRRRRAGGAAGGRLQ